MLPTNTDKNTPWPPTELEHIQPTLNQWAAWWSANVERLQQAYGGGVVPDSTGFFASDVGGFKPTLGQRFIRWFVGEPTRGPDRNTKLILPIAAEMAQASADLMFADPVKVKINTGKQLKAPVAPAVPSPDDPTQPPQPTKPVSTRPPGQDRVDELLDDGFHSTIAEAAESCAAIGGVFPRVSWDDTLKDKPFVSYRDADSAVPVFSYGMLVSVVFWDVVGTDKKFTYRLLESHDLDPVSKNGLITYGLFAGTDDHLGPQVPLSLRPETAALNPNGNPALQSVGLSAVVDTKSPGLAVFYVPNQLPNRLWRKHLMGRWLGRSDFDGVEHLMDQLAEAMSAWMRAVRLAKARILVAKQLLNNTGPGNPMVANLEQEVYTELNTLSGKDQALSDMVQFWDPKLDVTAHQTTVQAITEQILQMAGYSMQTFGVGDTGTVRTATEIESRERRSLMTRDRKIRVWKPAIQQLVEKLILVDNAFFGQSTKFQDVDVVFTDGVQETQLALAQTVQAMFAAESASLEKRVRILNPDLDDDDLSAEIELVRKEFAPAPMPSGSDPFGSASDPDPNHQQAAEQQAAKPEQIGELGKPGGPSAT